MCRVRHDGITRSTDVLDTWFSSALWPFATLGWPDDTEDLRTFYPGDLNTTARDIIRLWENRMIFAGPRADGRHPVPRRRHPLARARAGRRADVEEPRHGHEPARADRHYGADATRYGLMKMASAQDVRFAEGAIEEGRKLANKLWNVSRLILLASEGAAPGERPRTLEEHWILARLSQTQREAERLLGDFDFSHLVDELYHLTFDDFCDWYAESIKPRLYDGDADARATAVAALERLLKLLHPAMPHVTEEIWTALPERKTRLIVAAWPEAGEDRHAEALSEREDLAATFRRSGVLPRGFDAERQRIFDAVVRPEQQKVNGNVEAERERLRKEIERAEKQLANERFVANAPAKVVEAERGSSRGIAVSSTQFRTDELEAVAYDFWRAPEVAELDGWRLRFAHGITGRANSVWPNGDGTLPLDEKIERAEAWYRERGLATLFQLTEAARPAGLEAALVARGYEARGVPVSVEIASLDDVLARTSGRGRGLDGVRRRVARAVGRLARLREPRRGTGPAHGRRAPRSQSIGSEAVGRGVVDRIVARHHVDGDGPEARRRGRARAIVHALARWASAAGMHARDAAGREHEQPARTLYASAGFVPHHEYRYRKLS